MSTEGLAKKLWTLRYRLAGAVALAAVGGYVAFLYIAGPRIDAARVVRKDVVESVVVAGRVAAPYRVDIGSQIVGTVESVPVEQGQQVKAGDTLILLESTEGRAAAKQAEVAVAQAEARLRQLRELQLPVADQSLLQAQANLTNARAQFERQRKLFEAGYIGRSALDEAQRSLEVAQTQADAASKHVETARPTGSDYALAVAALDQARATLQMARARLSYTTIRASSDGVLIFRDVERGHVVQPGKILMVLSPAGETQLVLQVDERNLSKLALGQKAVSSADAYPARRFGAELVYINPGVDAQRGTVEVKLRVPDPPGYLRQDMTVSVDIETARRAGTLALAADAVHDAIGASPWVLAVRRGRAVQQPVKLGLRGEGSVEVLEGLGEGELVVPVALARVHAGDRLRAVPRE